MAEAPSSSAATSSSSVGPTESEEAPLCVFDTTEEDCSFFLCRGCNTHLAASQLFVQRFVKYQKQYALFMGLVNVKPDSDYKITNDKTTVQATYCMKCNADLGFRFLELKEPTDEVRVGRYIVYLNKMLLYRNGQEVDPEKEELLGLTMTDEHKRLVEDILKRMLNAGT